MLDVWKLCLCGPALPRVAAVVPSSERQPWRNVWVNLSRLCSPAGDGAGEGLSNPRWQSLLLVHVSTGNPDILHEIPGTQNNSSRCSPPSSITSETQYSHQFTLSTLFFSLQEVCLIWTLRGSRSCRLASLLQRHKIEYPEGAQFSLPVDFCYIVNILQRLASFLNRSTEMCFNSYLSRLSQIAPIEQIIVGTQFWNSAHWFFQARKMILQ